MIPLRNCYTSSPQLKHGISVRVALISLVVMRLAGSMASGGVNLSPMPNETSNHEPEQQSILQWLQDAPVLYENSRNPIVQELRIEGRYHGQHQWVRSNRGDADGWEDRRARLGAEASLFHKLTVSATINLHTEEDLSPVYESLDSAAVSLSLSDGVELKLGKFKPRWSHEWSTSSKRILTFERSLLVNQTRPKKSTGMAVSGKAGNWTYLTGMFSGDLNDEFGDLDGGWFGLGSIAYDFSERVGLDRLSWRADYLYNDPKQGDTAAPLYQHSFATSVSVGKDPFAWTNEFIYATGWSPDVFGVSSLLSVDLTNKWQAVFRYQYAHGENDSLRVQKRYERQAPNLTDGGRGGDYHAIYAGLNYYVFGDQLTGKDKHRLKFMTGVEWSTMDGGDDGGSYDGWTSFAGFRFYF